MVQLLLDKGADPLVTSNGKWTPLHVRRARCGGSQPGGVPATFLSIGETKRPSSPAPQCSARSGSKEITAMLLRLGANTRDQSIEGDTPLHWCAPRGSLSGATSAPAPGAGASGGCCDPFAMRRALPGRQRRAMSRWSSCCWHQKPRRVFRTVTA